MSRRWIYVTLAAAFVPIGIALALLVGVGVSAVPGNCPQDATVLTNHDSVECVVNPGISQTVALLVLPAIILWVAFAKSRAARPTVRTAQILGLLVGVAFVEMVIVGFGLLHLALTIGQSIVYVYFALAVVVAVPISLAYHRALKREAASEAEPPATWASPGPASP